MTDFSNIVVTLAFGIFTTWLWWLSRLQAKTSSQVSDLHRWHAPDHRGQQEWKNPRMDELIETMKGVCTRLEELTHQIELDRLSRQGGQPQPRRAP